MTLSGQQGGTTITTMAAHPQAVQVIQQPLQSQAYHLQQLYNTQGTPLIMPGNLALHPAGINPSSIQVNTNLLIKFMLTIKLFTRYLMQLQSSNSSTGHNSW